MSRNQLRQEMPISDSKSYLPRWLIVVLIVWAIVFVLFADFAPWNTATYRLEAQKAKAQLGSKTLAQAIEAYVGHEANKTHARPTSLRDLLNPPFGGSSFLRYGEEELLDPWGMPYQMEHIRLQDGTEYERVTTTAPDGTPISQFGIGMQARRTP